MGVVKQALILLKSCFLLRFPKPISTHFQCAPGFPKIESSWVNTVILGVRMLRLVLQRRKARLRWLSENISPVSWSASKHWKASRYKIDIQWKRYKMNKWMRERSCLKSLLREKYIRIWKTVLFVYKVLQSCGDCICQNTVLTETSCWVCIRQSDPDVYKDQADFWLRAGLI